MPGPTCRSKISSCGSTNMTQGCKSLRPRLRAPSPPRRRLHAAISCRNSCRISYRPPPDPSTTRFILGPHKTKCLHDAASGRHATPRPQWGGTRCARLPPDPSVRDLDSGRPASSELDHGGKPNSDDKQLQQSLIKALVGREVGAAGVIAGGLVVLFGMAPTAAAVVAAILLQVIVVPTMDVLCEEWDASIARSLASAKNSGAAGAT
jgi:hypothetical protein